VKPIRIDFIPSLVPKSKRTVWFAVVSTDSVFVLFTPATTPNGAPFGDYIVNCMTPAEADPLRRGELTPLQATGGWLAR
jgi:hypothetical protein